MAQVQVEITTFGYLHDTPPADAHLVADLRRHFRDPHRDPRMRYLTAHDVEVRERVMATPGIAALVDALEAATAAYLAGPVTAPVRLAVGCAGGRHRAAVVGAELQQRVRARGIEVELVHRDLGKDVVHR
ncbi:ATPase [Marinactinospora rubrisoli]|uniref:ATPase n=1 Tax=Marinactinospora rubrisoli TaxID=2715399 RepID=A0ABW2KN44_9ACTN